MLEEAAQVQQDHKSMGWLSLVIGVALMVFSFSPIPAPIKLGGFGSIFILGFGFAELGVTYLITGRHVDEESDQQRWIAFFIWGVCAVATIVVIAVDNWQVG
ncbi:MAG TPA: hypothetical protein VN086_01150 [Candidatus Paceibacterota bacterium]|nr:hypothetical protein [Candidatus Paceibacterota bacterium]